MIVPSIDILGGRAVQLRRGEDFVLDGGDPVQRLEECSIAGEVAVVDLDAALGRGSNAELIRDLVRRAPCRVGGGIRDLDSARRWLDAGAAHVMIGTAATPEFCGALPRERVIAAVDAERGEVVVDGWRARTGVSVLDRVPALAPVVGGFLFTQVEKEGAMGGFDAAAVAAVVHAASGARVTAAGGITTASEVAELDRLGADAQVGMALYTGGLSLGDAIAAPLTKSLPGDVWPTVVCDEAGRTLGLVWSTRASLARAVAERRGIYWSRSRQSIWEKGATSGNTQQLLRVDLDCDRDALRFTVRQLGAGFCHLGRRSCWPADFDLADLERTLADRIARPVAGSAVAGPLFIDRAALGRARESLPSEDRTRLERVAERIRTFADAQKRALGDVTVTVPGGTAGHWIAPLERAGCYAPGGRYPLPSSVLMTAVTAKPAGVSEVWVASPKPGPLALAAAEIARQLGALPTAAVAREALANGGVVTVASMEEGIAACDALAPEHVELFLQCADLIAPRLAHFGAVFIGGASAEVLGDYGAGPNHVLPTGGTARSRSGLSVYTFLRVRTWLRIDDGAAARPLVEDAAWFGRVEGLEGHARAAEARLD